MTPTQKLMRHIDADAAFQDYKKKKKAPPTRSQKILAFLLALYVVRASDLHGSEFVTKKAKEYSILLSWIASATNLINSAGFIPVAMGVCSGFGLFTIPASLAVSTLVNLLQNGYTAWVVKAEGRKKSQRAGLVGLIGLQVVLTVVAPIGMTLVNGKRGLAELLAKNILSEVETRIHNQRKAEEQSTKYQHTKKACEDGKKLLLHPPPGERDRLIIEVLGDHGTRRREGLYATPESLCGKWLTLQEEVHEKYHNLEVPIKEAVQSGLPSVLVLKQAFPDVYNLHFTQEEIHDGDTALALAFGVTITHLLRGDFSKSGSSLLFLLLSVVSSTALVMGIRAHTTHPAIMRSFSEEAGRMKVQFLLSHIDEK